MNFKKIQPSKGKGSKPAPFDAKMKANKSLVVNSVDPYPNHGPRSSTPRLLKQRKPANTKATRKVMVTMKATRKVMVTMKATRKVMVTMKASAADLKQRKKAAVNDRLQRKTKAQERSPLSAIPSEMKRFLFSGQNENQLWKPYFLKTQDFRVLLGRRCDWNDLTLQSAPASPSTSNGRANAKGKAPKQRKRKQKSKWTHIKSVPRGFVRCTHKKALDEVKDGTAQPKRLVKKLSRVHGNGAFAEENISRNQFIDEYLGELISDEELNLRDAVSIETGLCYLMELNENWTIDGAKNGNVTQYINSSKDIRTANVGAVLLEVDGDRKDRMLLFARNHIPNGTELLMNYQDLLDYIAAKQAEREETAAI